MLARGIPPIDLARPWGLQNLRMYSQDNLAAAAAAATTAVRLIGPNGANRRREYHTTPPPRRDLVPSNFLGMHKNFLNLMDELEKNLTPSVGNWGEEIWGPETANRDTRKGALRMFSPKVDVSETDKEFHVHCEVPGVDPKDLKVEFKGGVLSVRGEKKMEKKEEDKDKKYYRIERSSGKFSRSFRLENVDEKNISAKYKDGVLEIVVPKQQTQTQSNAIEIKTEGGQSQQQQQQDQKDQKDQKSESSSSSSQNKEGSQQYQGQQQHQQQHQQQQYQSEHPEGQSNKKSSYA